MKNYYVYVYIDPRNYEEFYYGKGKGSRKDTHLGDQSASKKVERIAEIKKEGLDPIIRVIAKDLTEQEALLVEKTLLWKLGKWTTNIAKGHFAKKFRPHNMFHKELSNFDYQNGIYYYNVGEGFHRNWDDYVRFGFISAGQGPKYRGAMQRFKKGDVVVAYWKRSKSVGGRLRRGFVGVGQILEEAKPIREVKIKGRRLLDLDLKCKNMSDNSGNDDKSEYVALIKWAAKVLREEAKWKKKSGLFTSTNIRASLDKQPKTIEFINEQFNVDIKSMVV